MESKTFIPPLPITLKRKWFDMIAAGIKKEEYRELKPYWCVRFMLLNGNKMPIQFWENLFSDPLALIPIVKGLAPNQQLFSFVDFTNVSANNGYSKDCPNIKWEHEGIRVGKPNPEWCEPADVDKYVFILKIGRVWYAKNFQWKS